MNSRWFVTPVPRGDAKVRLFCIPHAGGSASSFSGWRDELTPEAERVFIQLPGRGARIAEKPIDNMADLTAELATAMQPLLDRPYVLFGHSLGGRIAYALTLSFLKQHRLPDTLILSASRPPHAPQKRELLHKLTDVDLTRKLRQLGGTPEAILEDTDIMELYLPMIRADFSIAEAFFDPPKTQVDCDVLVYGGLQDSAVAPHELEMWQDCFTRPISMEMFEGGHFFIDTQRSAVTSSIRRALLRSISHER